MKVFKFLAMAIVAAGALLMSSACTGDEPGDVKNVLIINGQTYPLLFAMYAEIEKGIYNVDMNTKEFDENNQIHGYGELIFDGKDVKVDVSKDAPIYTSGFNWNAGGGFYAAADFKSGTQSAKMTKDGTILLIVDCIDQAGQRFYLNAELQDEKTIDWSQFD